MSQTLARLAMWVVRLALIALAAAYLLYLADHARQLLAYPFPLDYGEGPLQAQVERLAGGVPIWQLYADPAVLPFQIVNYPPLYPLVSAALAQLTGSALIAGRLVSLLSALGCVGALALLARPREPGHKHSLGPWLSAIGCGALFLTVPVVREWSVLMRVDMLGVCLGLWGLVVLSWRSTLTPARVVLAALLLVGCLYAKPSLIAAPLAAGGWLLWRFWRGSPSERRSVFRSGITLAAVVGIGGGLLFGLLQWASGGWFALHVVAANANRWELALALGFWEQQLRLRWGLALAAVLAAGLLLARRRGEALVLPGLYCLGGVIVAVGVGKVGAYSNYFLELYAGLLWVVALGFNQLAQSAQLRAPREGRSTIGAPLSAGTGRKSSSPSLVLGGGGQGVGLKTGYVAHALLCGLLFAALLYYPPLWDANRLRPAGLIEPSPPRIAFGDYPLWADAARERDVLAAQGRVNQALTAEVARAGPRILTDMPGVASMAGVESRLQAFEARQLFDQGLASDDALLLELANGELPLATIDFLGNWLTPGVVEILQRRYAHDGSLGTTDLYRPVDPGPPRPLGLPFATPAGPLELLDYRLAAPLGTNYEPGELLALSLRWRRGETPPPDGLTVVLGLTSPEGTALLAEERPLIYGVLPPARWPVGAVVEHMQPLALPAELPDGRYTLTVALRSGDTALEPPRPIASLALAAEGGSTMSTGYFVPASLAYAWAELGAVERAGLPLTPAVPFAWGRLQCFERVCLELRDGTIRQRPLGATLYLAETIRGEGCANGARAGAALCPGFAEGAAGFAELGAAQSGELQRNGWIVQWTANARLERPPEGGSAALGRLGDESLRLPPGGRYRWP